MILLRWMVHCLLFLRISVALNNLEHTCIVEVYRSTLPLLSSCDVSTLSSTRWKCSPLHLTFGVQSICAGVWGCFKLGWVGSCHVSWVVSGALIRLRYHNVDTWISMHRGVICPWLDPMRGFGRHSFWPIVTIANNRQCSFLLGRSSSHSAMVRLES